jgi:hypothetical protein
MQQLRDQIERMLRERRGERQPEGRDDRRRDEQPRRSGRRDMMMF